MARIAKDGPQLRWRMPGGQVVKRPNGKAIAQARFRHGGKRYALSTGKRDPVEAHEEAKRLYAEVIAGKHRSVVAATTAAPDATALAVDVASWIEALEATHDPRTCREYEWVAKHWLDRWPNVTAITAEAIADYARERLRVVTKETARKNLVALRTFLRWAREQQRIATMPDVYVFPSGAQGKRKIKREPHELLTPAQVRKILRTLPEWSATDDRKDKKGSGPKSRNGVAPYRVRDFYAFMWETGLRPATLERLSVPEHWRKGSDTLTVAVNVDKNRKAKRPRIVPLSATSRAILARCAPDSGPIFGDHERERYFTAVSTEALERRVLPYALKHSRITHWASKKENLPGIPQLTGVRLDTIASHYILPAEEMARRIVGAKR